MSSHPLKVDEVTAEVKGMEQELIALLSELVACDSRLGHPGETTVQEVMKSALTQTGFQEVKKININRDELKNKRGWSPTDWSYDGRYSLHAIFSPSSGVSLGKSLTINGHVDVVPIEPNHEKVWKTHPFSPSVRDGRLYGRGAGDMKSGIVCTLIALRVLRKLGYEPASRIDFHSVLEEECSGNGCLAVVESSDYKSDGVLIPEPLPMMSAQLGVMWFDIHIQGRPAHVLDTKKGINAIEAGFGLFAGLKKLEEEWNTEDAKHPMYKHMKHPVNFNLGRINGGVWQSSVPSNCTLQGRVGFYPGQSLEWVREEVEKALAAAAESLDISKEDYSVSYNGFAAEGAVLCDPSEPMSDFFSCLTGNYEKVLGEKPTLTAATCTTDCRFYRLHNQQEVTCYGPESNFIHGINESVSLQSCIDVSVIFAMFIAEWCGLQKI
eukprot:CAMPEP_0201510552 /NCGR_PEP_ID=MMETSP0161_2-20130828/3193_1 /ASSEMBLY_ACC=CAM_ASM_000251 /TAXON_ID=180227 /ORGANISM="Neoparamoeba aestuarina, Strain SoJaBio B1-5/56/2" /LENGTH=436 /DNA_ID=CAMNT_0047905741 /DNA_START=43 /DNA_END=1353 /DNA_ORIENTATION=-